MREINLNGYIDEDVFFGDEITPESLHYMLYGPKGDYSDDVHIRLNSYGGACNAAVRMHDEIRAYPGNVTITISGTAASAGTVLASAADKLMMTPGSLFFIHDPVLIVWGNERELNEALNLLKACKESIINVYGRRCKKTRHEIAAMMSVSTWMDARQALEHEFIDGITESTTHSEPVNSKLARTIEEMEAEAKVRNWVERRRLNKPATQRSDDGFKPQVNFHEPIRTLEPSDQHEPVNSPEPADSLETTNLPELTDLPEPTGSFDLSEPLEHTTPLEPTGTPIAQLEHRLGLIKPTR